MSTAKTRPALPITRAFTNDGRIPSDPLPLVLYRDTRRTNRIFSIPKVPRPEPDLVFGPRRPLIMLWRS